MRVPQTSSGGDEEQCYTYSAEALSERIYLGIISYRSNIAK